MPPPTPRSDLPDLLRPRRRPLPAWRRALYLAGAVLAFAAGLAGWVVPVVSGIPFWVAGAVLLAMAVPKAREGINALERRLPPSWRERLRRRLGKVRIRAVREAVRPPGGAAPRAGAN